jgi:hypothetical protein
MRSLTYTFLSLNDRDISGMAFTYHDLSNDEQKKFCSLICDEAFADGVNITEQEVHNCMIEVFKFLQ